MNFNSKGMVAVIIIGAAGLMLALITCFVALSIIAVQRDGNAEESLRQVLQTVITAIGVLLAHALGAAGYAAGQKRGILPPSGGASGEPPQPVTP